MLNEPQIAVLPYKQRKRFFWVLFVVFILALPSLIFYTTGYRLTFTDTEPMMVVPTGGMYISSLTDNTEVYIDEQQASNPRLFQSAYYVQNLSAGQHRVVVQAPGLHAWVKVLPVDPYIVTEAAAFTLPLTPQVRLITEWQSASGAAVVGEEVLPVLATASVTNQFIATSSTATTSLERNEEYDFLRSEFGTSTVRTSVLQVPEPLPRFRFSTSSSLERATPTTSTTSRVVRQNDIELVVESGEIYAYWRGAPDRVPHYFCVVQAPSSTLAARYGEHIAAQVARVQASTTRDFLYETANQWCRARIKLDRQWQDVYWFDFLPGSTQLVVLHRADGIVVTEIDDRAWQNHQALFVGDVNAVQIINGAVYLQQGDVFYEVFTELVES